MVPVLTTNSSINANAQLFKYFFVINVGKNAKQANIDDDVLPLVNNITAFFL